MAKSRLTLGQLSAHLVQLWANLVAIFGVTLDITGPFYVNIHRITCEIERSEAE